MGMINWTFDGLYSWLTHVVFYSFKIKPNRFHNHRISDRSNWGSVKWHMLGSGVSCKSASFNGDLFPSLSHQTTLLVQLGVLALLFPIKKFSYTVVQAVAREMWMFFILRAVKNNLWYWRNTFIWLESIEVHVKKRFSWSFIRLRSRITTTPQRR